MTRNAVSATARRPAAEEHSAGRTEEFAHSVERVASAVTALLLAAEPAEAAQVIAATTGEDEDALDDALWGPRPSRSEATAAVVANLRRQFARRRALETASLTRADAARLLGTSEQAVTDALEAHRLLGLKRGRRWLIPAWQFDPETERGMLPGLGELAAAFPGGIVALSAWATRPSPDLNDTPPRTILARGDVGRVVRIARALTAAGW